MTKGFSIFPEFWIYIIEYFVKILMFNEFKNAYNYVNKNPFCIRHFFPFWLSLPGLLQNWLNGELYCFCKKIPPRHF